MRVTIVSPFDPLGSPADADDGHVGGVEEVLASSARALARRGVDVAVLSTSRRPAHEVVDGVRHVRVRRLATLFRTPISGAFLHPLDADVVHVPATYPLYSDLLLARAARRLPVVLDYHFDVHPTSLPMDMATRAWEGSFARLMRRADVVLVKTREYAAQSRGLGWVPAERLRIVPNGVDPARFPLGRSKEGYVLCVGRLIPYKGVEVLVDAMERVQEERDAPLVVAGTGPLRPQLERRARDLGVDARFLGYVPAEDLPDLYARASVTALPSVNSQEAFGVTLLESMASGTPVVASDLPGPAGVAALGGLTARPGDPADLARALLAVLDGDPRVPGPDELRRRVVERYSWDAIAGSLVEAYRHAEDVKCAS